MSFISTAKQKYPPGLYAIFFMQMALMVGFMFIFSMATLYATHKLGFTDQHAYTLFAAYGAIIYGMPLFGGFLGDRFFGHKLAVLIGVAFCSLGLCFISIPNTLAFTLGLAVFAIGMCTMTPNIYCLVGKLYNKYDERRHSGFTIAYVGMNIGAFVATAASGYLVEAFGYSITFLLGAAAMLLTFISYYIGRNHFDDGFDDAGDQASIISQDHHITYNASSRLKGLLLFLAAIPICYIGFSYPEICNKLILAFGVLAVAFIIYLSFKHQSLQRKKLWVFLALTIVSVGFGILYMTAPTVLTLFAERNVDRHVFGLSIPTSSVLALNSFFIVLVGPLLSILWLWLGHRHKNPSGSFKLSLGVMMIGIGYVILVPAIALSNKAGMTAFYWIVISYFFQTVGELLVNPVGYALVGSLAPARTEGFLMGFFQLGTGVASVLMGYMANTATKLQGITSPLQTNGMYSHSFWQFGFYSLLLGLIAILFTPWFSKIIRQRVDEPETTKESKHAVLA